MGIIDFEVDAGNSSRVPDGYHGFHWDNVGVASHEPAGSGYANVLTSGTQVGLNLNAKPASFSADRDFDFRDGYFAAAWDDHLRVKFVGYDDGVKVAVHRVFLDQAKTYIAFDDSFHSIDRVEITTKGGVDADPQDQGRGAHVAFEDLEVHFETPPPAHHDFVI